MKRRLSTKGGEKKKLSPGKEFQEREVPKAGKLRRKITVNLLHSVLSWKMIISIQSSCEKTADI